MFQYTHNSKRKLMLAVAAGALAVGTMTAAPANAQDDTAKPKRLEVSKAKPVNPNVTINLLNALVKQGVLSEEAAQALIQQAEDEAFVARQSAKDATAKAEEASKTATAAAIAASPPGTKRVTYVPEIVKKQLREELKRDVMDKARAEHWASPGMYPEWASRIRFHGDFRARFEGQFFPSGNAQGQLYDFNAINTGSAPNWIDTITTVVPTYNATEDRNRARLRARLGLDADLFNGFTAGLRIATGDSNSPVSTNQTLGGSGGNFSKYSLWLDRAYLKYQPLEEFTGLVGRFDNPFWSAGDMVWNRDLGFDGGAVRLKYVMSPEILAFANAGAFPIFNSSLNASLTDDIKVKSHDKWLQGGQLGFSVRLADEWTFTAAGALYNFSGVQGKLSNPCDNSVSSAICDTDNYRPSFAQKGNTYFPLRNPAALLTGTGVYDYFGLASEFRPVVASGRLAWSQFNPVHVVFEAEFVKNTAFDKAAIEAMGPENNHSPNVYSGTTLISRGGYDGGDMGYFGRVTVGHPEIKHLWDWNVHVGYKYVESDATMDAFTDSDFGLGGTNLKGYFLGANLGLSENVWASLRWMSANSIAGSPYAVDIVQLDLNAKF